MQEYKDGSFGEISDGRKILKKLLNDEVEMDKTKAIHFGSKGALEKKKKAQGTFKTSVEKRLSDLETQQEKQELKLNEVCVRLGLRKDEVLRVTTQPADGE